MNRTSCALCSHLFQWRQEPWTFQNRPVQSIFHRGTLANVESGTPQQNQPKQQTKSPSLWEPWLRMFQSETTRLHTVLKDFCASWWYCISLGIQRAIPSFERWYETTLSTTSTVHTLRLQNLSGISTTVEARRTITFYSLTVRKTQDATLGKKVSVSEPFAFEPTSSSNQPIGCLCWQPWRFGFHRSTKPWGSITWLLTELQTVDKYGPSATILSREIGRIYGIRVFEPCYPNQPKLDGNRNPEQNCSRQDCSVLARVRSSTNR